MHTISNINLNFRIKVAGRNDDGARLNTLVGVSGLVDLIGEDMAFKLIARAFNSTNDKCECKLRRGIKVTFYNK